MYTRMQVTYALIEIGRILKHRYEADSMSEALELFVKEHDSELHEAVITITKLKEKQTSVKK